MGAEAEETRPKAEGQATLREAWAREISRDYPQPSGESVSHGYDAVGNRRVVSSAAGTPYYQYDALGRMAKVGQLGSVVGAAYYLYDADSRRTRAVLGNGVKTYFTYDSASRLGSRKGLLPSGSALVYFNYAYDPASRITKTWRDGGKTIYYSYDNADRLTGETWYNAAMQSVYAFSWSYDATGNRHWQNRLGTQSYYTYDAANALKKSLQVGGSYTYYNYDLDGNCVKLFAPNGTTYFAYNSVNLATRVTFRSGTTNYFYYDALNRRRALKDSSGAAYFAYDRDGLCYFVERNGVKTVTAQHTRGSAPIAGIGDLTGSQITTATTYYQYPVYDHRGNVERIVNGAGAVSGSFEYNAWGEKLLNQPPPDGTRFGMSAPAWIGLNDDPDAQTVLSPTRTYLAALGRFLQRDPLRRLAGRYRYARSNPLFYADANAAAAMPLGPSPLSQDPISSILQQAASPMPSSASAAAACAGAAGAGDLLNSLTDSFYTQAGAGTPASQNVAWNETLANTFDLTSETFESQTDFLAYLSQKGLLGDLHSQAAIIGDLEHVSAVLGLVGPVISVSTGQETIGEAAVSYGYGAVVTGIIVALADVTIPYVALPLTIAAPFIGGAAGNFVVAQGPPIAPAGVTGSQQLGVLFAPRGAMLPNPEGSESPAGVLIVNILSSKPVKFVRYPYDSPEDGF